MERQLQRLLSSEDEENDDDNLDVDFSDILNERLDEIQNINTDELLNLLSIDTEHEPNNNVNQSRVSTSLLSAEPVTEAVQESRLIQPQELGIETNNLPAGTVSSLLVGTTISSSK